MSKRVQAPVADLLALASTLTRKLDEGAMRRVVALLDALQHPLSCEDITALMSLLPADGDDAFEVNWTILHAIEASPEWPMWALLTDADNVWQQRFRIRLANAGIAPPAEA